MTLLVLSLLASAAELGPDAEPDPVEEATPGPDRSAPPPVVPADRLALPEPEVHTLAPGVEAWFVPVDDVRRVEVFVAVRRGWDELVGWPTEEAQAVGALMDVATERYAADILSELTDLHEVELGSWMTHHSGGVRLSVPREALDTGLELLGEVLTAPAYPKKDIKRHLRDRRLWYQVEAPASPQQVAWSALAYAWFPADHPYGARPDLRAMRRLRGDALRALHGQWLAGSPVTVVITGDLSWSELEPKLSDLLSGIGADAPAGDALAVDPPSATRVVAVDMPGQQQASLRLRMPAPLRDDPDRAAFELLDYAFGGHFLSRLNANLREDKGYTYGSGSRYAVGETSSSLTVSADVALANAGAAIREIERELELLVASGITADEIEQAVRSGLFDWNETRKTAASARAFYTGRLWAEETVAEAAARDDRKPEIEAAELTRVAARWLGPEATRVWVVVGDRTALAPQLEALGWDVAWIDAEAAVLGSF